MVTFPPSTPVTSPVRSSTVAISGSDVVQVYGGVPPDTVNLVGKPTQKLSGPTTVTFAPDDLLVDGGELLTELADVEKLLFC